MVQKLPQDESKDSQFQSIEGIGVRHSRQVFSKSPKTRGGTNIVTCLGIANDEPKRIAKHIGRKDVLLPLVEARWDEDMCGLWCKYNDMLSPTYTHSFRDGCWFCHNQGIDQLKYLYHNYPELWQKLLALDKDSPVTFHADGHTVHDFDRRFKWEDEGYLPMGNSFRWDDTVNQQMNIYQFLEE